MLSNRLNQLISVLDIKKGDFAEKINFTPAYISMILSGKKENPSDRFYESLKREFNVNPYWLKNGSGEMFLTEDIELTPLDREIITKYNRLTLSERKVVDQLINSLIERNKTQKSPE